MFSALKYADGLPIRTLHNEGWQLVPAKHSTILHLHYAYHLFVKIQLVNYP
jgi:hypothetical protein